MAVRPEASGVTIVEASPGEPVKPGLLPRDAPGFTGRAAELSRLVALAGVGHVAVAAISGTAGVGKTALAVHAAHCQLAEFADGQLYADLRGYTEGQDPVEPGEVLEAFLRSLGVTAEDVPVDVAGRSGLLRQLLASKRVVMVLDNARTEAQVRPLVPGAGASLVLVTSRSTLPGLEADERISLDVLSQDEAVNMLAGLGGHRAAADPTAVAEVARLCGRLPLALRIAGQLLATHPTWPVVRLAQLLASEQGRLARLGAGDLQVRAAFEVSYQQLADEDARLFRLLGLHPGPDFTSAAPAALAEIHSETAEQALDRLAQAHLVTEDTAGRFSLHDLLRLFARATTEQADAPEERTAAETRLVRHYEDLAAFLDSCVDPDMRALAARQDKPLSSIRQALSVFEAERPSLLAALGLAAQRGWDRETSRLSDSIGGPLKTLRYLDDLLTAKETALAPVRQLGDAHAEGLALTDLGIAFRELRRFEEAIASSQAALAIFRKIGDRNSEGGILNNLGAVYGSLQRPGEAIASFGEALVMFREVGDRRGEGQAQNNLGNAYQELGQFEEAIATYQEALTIFGETRDLREKGRAGQNLGLAYEQAGRLEESIASRQQALAIFRETGDQDAEGATLADLRRLHEGMRQPDEPQRRRWWQRPRRG